ncbi:MAG: hypothetical protein IJ851_03030 [Eubacterium sp.]|nr:hypothetical protein [Eubacterium sp.]
MKVKNYVLFISLLVFAVLLITFSSDARQGALDGIILAQNTVVPSLLPILIIVLVIMKSGAGEAASRLTGFFCTRVLRLPAVCSSAILFGLVGGYPTGALLTAELYGNDDIDSLQARRMMCFNFCGGCGFIITAVGSARLNNSKLGLLLFASNVVSSIVVGFVLSRFSRGCEKTFYTFRESLSIGDALVSAVNDSVKSVINITAYIVLFSAFNSLACLPKYLLPIAEITSGICGKESFSLPMISAYLAFGGFCIHLQLLSVLKKIHMPYYEFFLSRLFCAVLSYFVTRFILFIFPLDAQVFLSQSESVMKAYCVSPGVSVLLVLGCVILVLDVSSKRNVLCRI